MKISLGNLRKIIQEVAMSPSLGKNNVPTVNPLENSKLDSMVTGLSKRFKEALILNLVVSKWDTAYDEQSRQFNDDEYEQIVQHAESLSNDLVKSVQETINAKWREGHKQQQVQLDKKHVA